MRPVSFHLLLFVVMRNVIRIVLCVAIMVGAVAAVASRKGTQPPRQPEAVNIRALMEKANAAVDVADWDEVKRIGMQIPADHPQRSESLLTLGESALRLDAVKAAQGLFDLIPRDHSESDIKARIATAGVLFKQGLLQQASDDFEYVLKHHPEQVQVLSIYSLLLDFSNQRFRSSQLLFTLLRKDYFSTKHLMYLANPATVHEPTTEIKREKPDDFDAIVNLENARYLFTLERLNDSETFLRKALEIRPELVEAQVRLGEIALARNDEASIVRWYKGATDQMRAHPAFWEITGQWLERVQDFRAAARCYWECLKLEPNTRIANYRLGQILPALGKNEQANRFLEQAAAIGELTIAIDVLYFNENHLESMKAAAEATLKMGRYWEAVGWSRASLLLDNKLDWALAIVKEHGPRLQPDSPRNDPALTPSLQIDLSEFPLPNFAAPSDSKTNSATAKQDSQIQFTDDAHALGVDFTYFNGPDPTTASGRMFEFTGGGIAVLDYDLDGRPDLYFSQGCEWPPKAGSDKYLDRLYRKVADVYKDVTASAALFEERFGQGANIGDFDQDGFPDVYVATTHVNRLWRNLGDGTFEDGSLDAGFNSSEWTTSCLVADLNGDALPDLVDVNYAQGDDLFVKICELNGVARSCSPLAFKACNDRILVNQGDGRFQDVTHEAGFELGDGRGLGIVAFSPGREPGMPGLFVANDMTANFFFENKTPQRAAPPTFLEQGVVSGLAFDVNGSPQASMGVATADVDGNGLLDFFVTNFYNETNNMYLQQPEGGFIDAAAATELRDPGVKMLGFGTQFLDANLDGWSDLIVTNGHVDDFRHDGLPYQMRNQFFENLGDAKFVERRSDTLGAFFDRELLGRGMAKFDWNRDRREDVITTYLEQPISILTNRTETPFHAISVQLRGTTVDREAIGSIVEVESGGRKLVAQVTGGDGYMASNERRLIFGLGTSGKVDRLRVLWTDGKSSEFVGLDADQDYIIRQGSETGIFHLP